MRQFRAARRTGLRAIGGYADPEEGRQAPSGAASDFAAELQRGVGIDRGGHQIAEAFLQQRLYILAVDVRVPAGDIVLFADCQHFVHRRHHGVMVILPRNPEVLRQIAFADDYHTDPRNLFQHLRQIVDRAHLLTHDRDQYLALRVERPDIGAPVIFLLRQTPVARRSGRRIAALARRLEIGRRARARIAARGDRITRLFDGADMRPYDAVHALVQYLLRDPLADLAAIRRNAHKRSHCRRQRAGLDDLATIQHVLQTVAQCADVVWPVFHLEYDAVVRRGSYRLGHSDFRGGEADEGGLILLQCGDYAIEARYLGHCPTPCWKKFIVRLPARGRQSGAHGGTPGELALEPGLRRRGRRPRRSDPPSGAPSSRRGDVSARRGAAMPEANNR